MFDTKTFNEYVSKGDVICALVDKGQRSTRYKIGQEWELNLAEMQEAIDTIPIAKVQKEEDVYKFYYCKSEDDYYIGRRVDMATVVVRAPVNSVCCSVPPSCFSSSGSGS